MTSSPELVLALDFGDDVITLSPGFEDDIMLFPDFRDDVFTLPAGFGDGGAVMNSPSLRVLLCVPRELGTAKRLLPGSSALDYMSGFQFLECTMGPCQFITHSCSAFLLITDSIYKDSLMHTQIARYFLVHTCLPLPSCLIF